MANSKSPESSPDRTGLPSGDQSAVEPPGPIPNPEVKRCSADGIGTTGPVRVGRRQVFARPRVTSGPGAFFVPPRQKSAGRPAGPWRRNQSLSTRKLVVRNCSSSARPQTPEPAHSLQGPETMVRKPPGLKIGACRFSGSSRPTIGGCAVRNIG